MYNVDVLVPVSTVLTSLTSNYHYILSAIHVRDQVAGVKGPGPTHIWPGRPGVGVHIRSYLTSGSTDTTFTYISLDCLVQYSLMTLHNMQKYVYVTQENKCILPGRQLSV